MPQTREIFRRKFGSRRVDHIRRAPAVLSYDATDVVMTDALAMRMRTLEPI